MREFPDEAGYLYLDGHICVHHEEKASLSRQYMSREHLCLRGATDYWVNDVIDRPYYDITDEKNLSGYQY